MPITISEAEAKEIIEALEYAATYTALKSVAAITQRLRSDYKFVNEKFSRLLAEMKRRVKC